MRGLDAAGRRRSPATLPGHHTGRAPRNKGMRYPADPPRVEEIIAVMREAGDGHRSPDPRPGRGACGAAGLRIWEALELSEGDLESRRGALLGPAGQGRQAPRGRDGRLGLGAASPVDRPGVPTGRRALLRDRRTHPRARLVGRPRSAPSCAALAAQAGVRRRFAPHQLRHATRSRWRARASRSTSSSASSATPTSASPRSTSRGSTAPR